MQNTTHVVDYIVASRFEAIPAQALTVAKGAIQDCVGVALAGARHPAGAIPAEWARKQRRHRRRDGVGPELQDRGARRRPGQRHRRACARL